MQAETTQPAPVAAPIAATPPADKASLKGVARFMLTGAPGGAVMALVAMITMLAVTVSFLFGAWLLGVYVVCALVGAGVIAIEQILRQVEQRQQAQAQAEFLRRLEEAVAWGQRRGNWQ